MPQFPPLIRADESARVKSLITIAVQVNGKLRANIEVAPGSDQETVNALAMAESNVQRHVGDKIIRKVILVYKTAAPARRALRPLRQRALGQPQVLVFGRH